MAKTIYKLFLGKMSEAWYQLSPQEQESLMAKVDSALDQVGGSQTLICDSSWSSEQWQFFGIEEFSDIEAGQKHADLLGELNWSRYVESMTVLGTRYGQ